MAFPLKTVVYYDKHRLKLHVYVVGYPVEGESILVVVAEDDRPLLTIVTDCYETVAHYNHVSAILEKEWGDPALDAFIWTHPHRDHSVGILTLIDNHDKNHNGYIISPINMVGLQHYPDAWSQSSHIQKELIKRYPPNSDRYYFRGYDPQSEPLQFRFRGVNSPTLNLSLDFVAPNPIMVAQQLGNKKCLPNKGSLAFLLSINGIDVFMGGDLDEACVPLIKNDVYRHVNLIKIPHHGSEHTGEIHKKFGMNQCTDVHAATTVFTKSHDPKADILKGYHEIGSEVRCTGPQPGDIPKEPYGCLHYIYDLASSKLEQLITSPNTFLFVPDEKQGYSSQEMPAE